jgi:MFS family permease
MSHQHHYSPPRDQLVDVLRTKTMPDGAKKLALGLGIAGLLLFVFGAATGVSRAWQSFLVNWLFFTTIASAGVMFVAVQRIVTARWSRGVIRFLEGFVAFLPFALIGLLIIIFGGQEHIYPWWKKVGIGYLIPEKEVYFNHTFFYLRSIIAFGGLAALQIWYVWTTVRLDVGVTPEFGASWAAGIRAKMRANFGEERRELHSTHSLQGKLAVVMALVFGFGWVVLAWDHSMSLDYHFFSTMYGWQVFMGGWLVALMVWAVLLRWYKGQFPELPELITEKHYHDVGKLCFAFTAFWGYLTTSSPCVSRGRGPPRRWPRPCSPSCCRSSACSA